MRHQIRSPLLLDRWMRWRTQPRQVLALLLLLITGLFQQSWSGCYRQQQQIPWLPRRQKNAESRVRHLDSIHMHCRSFPNADRRPLRIPRLPSLHQSDHLGAPDEEQDHIPQALSSWSASLLCEHKVKSQESLLPSRGDNAVGVEIATWAQRNIRLQYLWKWILVMLLTN